jgi:Zn-dependent protease
MFGRSFRIATVGGIPVNVDSSWIWIAVLAIYTLWSRFDARFPVIGGGTALAYAVLAAGLFFGSVFLHELAHGVSAKLSGIRVEGITLVFFGGFTAARADEKGPGPAFVISALGPATSLALGGIYWWLARLTEASGGPLPQMFRYVGFINLLMAVFNVLPGLPLDGGRMLESAVWGITKNRRRGTQIAAVTGMGLGGLLVAAALYRVTQQDLFGAVWFGIIGMFIFQGARASRQQAGVTERLAKATVADAMDPPPPAVAADLTLSEALERFLSGHEDESFPVLDSNGQVLGVISFASARELGSRDPLRPAREAVVPLERIVVVHPDEPLDGVVSRIGATGGALVLRDGTLVGAITGRSVSRWFASSGG